MTKILAKAKILQELIVHLGFGLGVVFTIAVALAFPPLLMCNAWSKEVSNKLGDGVN